MNWRIHWIGTNGTFQQLMNTCSRSNSSRTNNMINVISVSSITRFQGRKLRVMRMMLMWMLIWMRMKNTVLDLIFIHSIGRWNTLNAIQVHDNQNWTKSKKKREIPSNQNRKFHRLNYLGISLSSSIFSFQFKNKIRKMVVMDRWEKWILMKQTPLCWRTCSFLRVLSLSLSYRGCLVCEVGERKREKGKRTVGLWYWIGDLLIQRWMSFLFIYFVLLVLL